MSTQSLFKSLKLPVLGFGAASISGEGGGYSFGKMDEDQAISLLREAQELGIKLFDTAPIYGFGESELRLGRAFKKNRDNIFYISKCGVTWHENGRVNMTNDPKVSLDMLHQSLRDLQTDHIDLYMVHWPDPRVDIRATLEPLVRAQEVGKIKYLGLCNTNESEIKLAQEVAQVRVVQNELNLFSRGHLELIEKISKQQISFMSWGTLDKGILTATVKKGRRFDSSDCRSWAPWWKAIDKDPRYQAVEKLQKIIRDTPHTLPGLAIGHNLSIDGVDMVLCGMKNSQQLHSAWEASLELPDSKLIERALEVCDLDAR